MRGNEAAGGLAHDGEAVRGLNTTLMVVIGLAALALMVSVVLMSDEADAWSTKTANGDSGNYLTGSVDQYRRYYSSSHVYTYEYHKYNDYSPEVEERDGTSTYYTYRYLTRAWVAFPLYFDERTNIHDAELSLDVEFITTGFYAQVVAKVLRLDPRSSGAQEIYDEIYASPHSLGSNYIQTTNDYIYSFDSNDASYVESLVSKGEEYLFIGFYGYSSFDDEQLVIDDYYSYVTFWYDASAPSMPRISSPSSGWVSNEDVRVDWSSVSDQPSGGNSGLDSHPYQIGVFSSSSYADLLYTVDWTSSTSDYAYNLPENTQYYIRVHARDSQGFVSSWSSYIYVRVDLSPPSIPVIETEPQYTMGTSNTIDWMGSTDDGVGLPASPNVVYNVHFSSYPDFRSYSSSYTRPSQYSRQGLVDGRTYYYRVRAQDAFGHWSEWSNTVFSTQDDSPPSIPESSEEPLFTPGDTNTFYWQPSVDAGIGVNYYICEISPTMDFSTSTMYATTSTSATFSNLLDGTTYYVRVWALDDFDHESAKSAIVWSVQDASGPSGPGLHPLPTYSPNSTIPLGWNGSMDAGVGVGWYNVTWSTEEDFSANVTSRDHVLGHAFELPPLVEERTWYVSVVAFDLLGNAGDEEVTNTVVDGTPPEAPALDAEPEYTAGTENTISWQPATDDLSGVDHYTVRVYSRAAHLGLSFTEETYGLLITVPNLADGGTYWYEVIAVDAAGNANASAVVSSTQDASPPTPPMATPLAAFSPGSSVDVSWQPSIDAGAGGVEYMLEWSMDMDFSLLTGYTEWQSEMMYEVEDLADGVRYYFRAKSRDSLGQESMYGQPVGTTMDATAPPAPEMRALEPFLSGPSVSVGWGAVADGSGQPVDYMVMAFLSDEPGTLAAASSPWLMVTSHVFTGLTTDVPLYFRVVARDHLGWESEPSLSVTMTIDHTGPSEAVIDELDDHTRGTSLTLTWTVAEDAGVEGVEHRVVAYSDEALTTMAARTDWTPGTEAMVRGLVDGVTYWFVVECRDGFAIMGNASEPASTTMDASPPVVTVDAPGVFNIDVDAITGTCSDAGSGVTSVEVSGDGGDSWEEAEVDDGAWSIDGDDLPEDVTHVMVRATDAVGNSVSAYAQATVDTEGPAIVIESPADGAEVSGAVVVFGSITDPNLVSYLVEVAPEGSDDWDEVQPSQATSGVSGVLATWLTAGEPGGQYTIRVTAVDALGSSSSGEVDVVLKGAHLTISPADITLSNSHPLPGDQVTAYVTVRNDGDSPAEDVTVRVYDGGTEVGQEAGLTVPAHGCAVVPVTIEASGSHDITARAESDLYDTGEMAQGQPLETIEEEAALENAGGMLGLVALIIAILAVVLALMMGRRGGDAAPVEPSYQEEVLEPERELEPLPPTTPTPPPQGPEGPQPPM